MNSKILETSSFSHKAVYSFASYPKHTKLAMPALSPTMKNGTIATWSKKVGEKLGPGDVLCEVETDKASVGFEMQEEGYLAKILLPEGSKDVPVGQIVAILVDSEDQVKAFENFTLDASSETAAAEEKPAAEAEKPAPKPKKKKAAAAGGGKSYPKHEKVAMPALSPTMKNGKIATWTKKEGEKLSPGDVLCEVETDKASVGFEIQEEGYLAKILVQAGGSEINVGELVAITVENEADCAAFKSFVLGAAEEGGAEEEEDDAVETVALTAGQRVFISPLAKKTALEAKIPVEALFGKGTGPSGRVLKGDVDKFIASGGVKKAEPKAAAAAPKKEEKKPTPAAAAAPPKKAAAGGPPENPFTDVPLTNMRKIIASRLLEAKSTIPHFYLTISVPMDAALKLREQLNKEQTKVKISVNDILIKAAGLACVAVPEVNSYWMGDKIRQFKNADVSIAVSTDTGLITPIVFNANSKGISEIALNAKDLAGRARKGGLKPQEFQGGTFCISNLGMFAIDQFSAVINPPQACILAVGTTVKAVVPNDVKDPTKDLAYRVISTMRVTLSCDHRLVDGSVGARWLQVFKDLLEKPHKMLL